MRISDWSSDVCSSDLGGDRQAVVLARRALAAGLDGEEARHAVSDRDDVDRVVDHDEAGGAQAASNRGQALPAERDVEAVGGEERSEERRVGKECGSTGRSRWSPYP